MIVYFAGYPGGVWEERESDMVELNVPRLLTFYWTSRTNFALDKYKDKLESQKEAKDENNTK
jgi:hypothetical protein